jgi:hypothetical protein
VIVWTFETNLMWSSKLRLSLRMLGHECILLNSLPTDGTADVAIVNLGEGDPKTLIQNLRARGIPSIAHAGHKEMELHEVGREAGADYLVTNSEITHKLPDLLAKIEIG